MEEEKVNCSKHGIQAPTFVCQHIAQTLIDNIPRGFLKAWGSGELRPNAWCRECDKRLEENNWIWDDETEDYAGVTLICGKCYDIAEELNDNNP